MLPRNAWSLENGACTVRFPTGLDRGIYEAIYRAEGSPVAGLGLAAVRDFASCLRHGDARGALRESPAALEKIIGFGYSQSARFLREFVRDGFNTDERGRPVFDGLMIAAAGAGVGSFNHRFATPGMAGNSVLDLFRPVDVTPFTDDGLLKRARRDGPVPRIFYVFTLTEYWARGGSLTHTSSDGQRDIPFAETSRLYLLAGTPHSRLGPR